MSFLAVGADTEYSMTMMKRFESIVPDYFILQSLDLFVVELDQRAATGTDQMVVMSMLVFVLVKHPPVVELEFPGETTLFKQLQCAIYGSEPNRCVLCLHYCVQIFAGDMSFCIQKHIEYQIALTGSFEPGALEMFLKDLFLFAFHKCGWNRQDYTLADRARQLKRYRGGVRARLSTVQRFV